MEFIGLGFQPVLRGVPGGAAAAAIRRIHIQQHRQVRLEAVGGPFVECADRLGAQVTAGTLVRHRGIDVAVGEDDVTAVQRGTDDLAGVGCA